MMTERWVVVEGDDMRGVVTTRNGPGATALANDVYDLQTGTRLFSTIIFHVPDDFADAWRRNRP